MEHKLYKRIIAVLPGPTEHITASAKLLLTFQAHLDIYSKHRQASYIL